MSMSMKYDWKNIVINDGIRFNNNEELIPVDTPLLVLIKSKSTGQMQTVSATLICDDSDILNTTYRWVFLSPYFFNDISVIAYTEVLDTDNSNIWLTDDTKEIYECSDCGFKMPKPKFPNTFNYCPSCGSFKFNNRQEK